MPESRYCPNCDNEITDDARCPHCLIDLKRLDADENTTEIDFFWLHSIVGFLVAGIFWRYFTLEFGFWLDGFPFGLFLSAPGYILGSIGGILVGRKIRTRVDKPGLSAFICTFLGGALGSLVIALIFS